MLFRSASARTAAIKKKSAGVSGLTRQLLRDLFLVQMISDEGVAVEGSTVKVDFYALLGDEEALNAMFLAKGASGITPCGYLCSVVNKPLASDRELGIPSLSERSPLIADITCNDLTKIALRTDADVWSMVDSLRTMAGDAKKLREQATGFSYHPDALLYDRELRDYVKPATSARVDPMHIIYSNGVLASEFMSLFKRIKQCHGVYFAELREYLGPWKAAGMFRVGPLSDFVNEHRERASGDMLKVCLAS